MQGNLPVVSCWGGYICAAWDESFLPLGRHFMRHDIRLHVSDIMPIRLPDYPKRSSQVFQVPPSHGSQEVLWYPRWLEIKRKFNYRPLSFYADLPHSSWKVCHCNGANLCHFDNVGTCHCFFHLRLQQTLHHASQFLWEATWRVNLDW